MVPIAPLAPIASVVLAPPKPTSSFVLRGEYWEISYSGYTAMIEDCRGLRYIALLIRRAGAGDGPVHAKELAALAIGHAADPIELEAKDTVLDGAARRALVDRLEELAGERDRACATNSFDRAADLDQEYERIADELSRSRQAKGGRPAAFDTAGERARKAVSKAIAETITRIRVAPGLSPLADHLTSTIRKGQWLSYTDRRDWHIDFQAPLPRK
jgi:hypothetical protein